MVTTNVNDYFNREVVGPDGSKIGSVSNVFVDEGTDDPEWVTVKTGMFGSHESFVPIAGSSMAGSNELSVPFSKDQVKDAPHFDTDQALTEADESALYSHYKMARGTGYTDTTTTSYTDTATVPPVTTGTTRTGTVGNVGTGLTDDAMTRSEEQLHVGTEKVQTGKAKLRKYIVTENVTKTVPVTREEVHVVREPITDANRTDALSGPELTEAEFEVPITEERVITSKETVPVERVKLATTDVTENQSVTETLRHEEIVTEGVDDSGIDPKLKR